VTVQRSDRLASLLRQEINEMLQRGLKDPRLAGVSVTRVELSADCRHGRVLFTLLADQSGAEGAGQAFVGAVGYIRRQLGRALRLRQIPELRFEHDAVLHQATDVRLLIDKVVQEDRERQIARGDALEGDGDSAADGDDAADDDGDREEA